MSVHPPEMMSVVFCGSHGKDSENEGFVQNRTWFEALLRGPSLTPISLNRYFHHMNDLGQALLKHAYREKGKYGMIHLNSRNSHYFGFSPSEQGYKSVFSEIVRQYQGYDTCNPECLTFKMC